MKQHWFPVVEGKELKLSSRFVTKLMLDSSSTIALRTVVKQQPVEVVATKAKIDVANLSAEEVSKRKQLFAYAKGELNED